jgi:hypothetical protein
MMMNKLHVLALTGLMVSGINNASMMGQEQREVLYTLNTLGQDFANVPMISQNIDMFKGVLEMNIQVNTAKLQDANQKIKNALLKNAALLGGVLLVYNVSREGFMLSLGSVQCFDINTATPNRLNMLYVFAGSLVNIGIRNILDAAKMFAAFNIYDAWKSRSALVEAIALDKEILSKLEEIDASMDFLAESPAE